MTTEYWLQKKAFNSWSHVTWYPTEEECRINFERVAVEGNGYSWRMVSVEVIEERLLQGERAVMRQDEDEEDLIREDGQATEPKSDWGGFSIPDPANGYAKENRLSAEAFLEKSNPAKQAVSFGGWGSTIKAMEGKSNHGMVGKVWLGNPSTKEKKRVDPSAVDAMIKEGWVKAGPRTVL